MTHRGRDPFSLGAAFAFTIGILVFALLAFAAKAAETLEGLVVHVADGDTITMLDQAKVRHKVRLHGIDAPERGQPFGSRSKEALSQLVVGKEALARCHKQDRFGRKVCQVQVRPRDCSQCVMADVGLAQVASGLAWHFKRYAREQIPEDRSRYADTEVDAQRRRIGLWGDATSQPSWEWRRATASGGRP